MKILITSKVAKEIYDQLDKDFDISYYHDSNVPMSQEEIKDKIEDVEGLVCPLSDSIGSDIMDQAKKLKIIANYGAGYDNIDLGAASDRNLVVTNAPAPSSAVSTAELTMGLIIASARKIVQGERDLRAGGFMGWRPSYFLGTELRGKTLGIIGMGNIGKNVAKRALAFEMDLIYHSRNRKVDMEDLGIRYVSFEDLIKKSDFISLHTAYAQDLHHMIGKDQFDQMKESAFLINAARGPLVDEDSLVQALKDGKIAGAGLDVYEFEPKIHPGLLDLDNVVLAPHLGNATIEARLEMGQAVVDNLRDFKAGKEPRNRVN